MIDPWGLVAGLAHSIASAAVQNCLTQVPPHVASPLHGAFERGASSAPSVPTFMPSKPDRYCRTDKSKSACMHANTRTHARAHARTQMCMHMHRHAPACSNTCARCTCTHARMFMQSERDRYGPSPCRVSAHGHTWAYNECTRTSTNAHAHTRMLVHTHVCAQMRTRTGACTDRYGRRTPTSSAYRAFRPPSTSVVDEVKQSLTCWLS